MPHNGKAHPQPLNQYKTKNPLVLLLKVLIDIAINGHRNWLSGGAGVRAML